MDNKVTVYFPNQDMKMLVEKGTTVMDACNKANVNLEYVCGGRGTCGKCSVDIADYNDRKSVLACQTKINTEIKIYVSNASLDKKANILTSGNMNEIGFNPTIKKIHVQRKEIPFCASAWENLIKFLGIKVKQPSLSLLQKFSLFLQHKYIDEHTLVLWKDELLDIEKGDTSTVSYGFAIDIGTTTIAAYLYNLYTGEKMGVYSTLNRQVELGADVITRIAATNESFNGLKELQSKAISSINELISRAVNENNIDYKSIYSIIFCGNSAMQHLFFGFSPNNLGRTPFSGVIYGDVITTAKELKININPNGIIQFLPLIGGFVGADTTAVLLSLYNEDANDKMRLLIDLGTNGEIVLGNRFKMLAASTAAGPALEGAGIKFGMRGTNGAIERVKLSNGTVELGVIMNENPIGICGSGLIDTIAEMLKVGIIDKSGKLLTKEVYLKNCNPIYSKLSDNLEKINNLNTFILVHPDKSKKIKKIYLTQKDIRAVQLAKGAIYTGCMLLVKTYKLKYEEIDEIVIAGAFGNFIDVENGQRIGLFPKFEGVPIKFIGNAAGTGVQQFLLSSEQQNVVANIIKNASHIELASNPNFQQEFIKNVEFP